MLWGSQMPLLRINAIGRDLVLHETSGNIDAALRAALRQPGPVVIMVHGYKFLPGDPIHCPHEHIYSFATQFSCNKAVSWPRQLGFGGNNSDEGLAIAFGWQARGTLRAARDSTRSAAMALARLVRIIRAAAPSRQINLLAHSLGAHLVLETMRGLARYDLSRVILMNGAAYQSHALSCLATPAGRTCEVINVTSRENALYDQLYSWVLPSEFAGDLPLGHGIPARNVLSLRIDCPRARAMLQTLGYPIAPEVNFFCHWSTYLRPGLFAFYRALIRDPATLSLNRLEYMLDRTPQEVQEKRRGWLLPYGTRQAS